MDLNGGTFGFGINDVRTESRNDAGLQGNAGAQSGMFETSAPAPFADWPTSTPNATANFDASGHATSSWHFLDIRHDNPTNNYALQFAGGFFTRIFIIGKQIITRPSPGRKFILPGTEDSSPVLLQIML